MKKIILFGDSIAAGLDELMGDLNLGTDLIGEGEEL